MYLLLFLFFLFKQGEIEKMCEIRIIDDTTFEIDESFKVKVKGLFGGKVDQSKSQSVVTIRNDPRDGKCTKHPYFTYISFKKFW